jgi:hypothetical protein
MSRRSLFTLVLATSTAALVACATDDGASITGGAGGKADSDTAAITFADDWSESVRGELVAGSPVRISYDLDRLTQCRGSTGGSEVWGVSGYASFDGGAPVSFAVSRLESGRVRPVVAELEIPSDAQTVEMWFAVNNRWGCIAYDSNMNANYAFDIAGITRGPVLSFDADFSESQTGPLHAGEQVVVHYEPERLAQCAASSGGYAKWSVTMHYKVDGGAVKTMSVTRAEGSMIVPADSALTIPSGRDLEVWFSSTNVYGCHAYDSNAGANYDYTIE